jgi:glyoxylase-like metal-dependent hydrolase (beta-lactamase superfamily II)
MEETEMIRIYDPGLHRPFFLSLVALLIAAVSLFAEAADTGQRKVTTLADGVYTIQHKSLNDGNPSGNTTVIIGDRQVFVVDSCYLPSSAREDIAQIRQWTDKPVGYLLNTHFHNDHNNGNKTYLDAFPSLAIIAQEETKKDMDLIQPGNIERAPIQTAATIAALKEGKLQNGRTLSEDEKKQVQELLPGLEQREAEFKTMVYQPPTLTFTDKLDIDVGHREIQVKHLGRGNTPGDTIVYLPKEKILVTGDLVVHPIPYTYDGYPAEWVQTLQNMAQLDSEIIVPGHGPVLHGKTYLYLVTDLFKSAVDQVRARIRLIGHPGFHSLEDVKGSVDLTAFRPKFAGDDKDLQAEFDDMTGHLVKIAFNEAALR